MKTISQNTFIALTTLLFFSVGCIQGTGSGTRSLVKDYSVTNNTTVTGCGTNNYIQFSTDFNTYTCPSSCATGTHIATTNELANFKSSATELVLSYLNKSKGLCISDASAERPTGEVYIDNSFCSCLNGKSDIINDCDSFCATNNKTAPTLYATATLGSSISKNTKLGSLYNWCTVQLTSDNGTPGCTLSASDENGNTIENIPVVLNKNANSFTADISLLSENTTYVVKLVESKAGSSAASTEFQIRRVKQSTTDTTGALKVTPISQYTCLQYGGTVDANGTITRNTYAGVYYYYPANETPAPIPSAGGTNQSQVVCHDEISNPGTDNALYPRLQNIPAQFTLWDKTESRFVKTSGIMKIITTIQTRMAELTGTTTTLNNFFTLLSYPSRPNISASSSSSSTTTASNVAQGYMMLPFINSDTNKAYCPTSSDYNGKVTLFKVLKDYMTDTEGLYLGEKEAETIQDGTGYKTIYGTMFVTEGILTKYGFYLQNGLKVKATASTLHNKTIYYYWPLDTSPSADPLAQAGRKLFTVRYYDELNGNSPSGVSDSARTSDKRIGCVPKTTN